MGGITRTEIARRGLVDRVGWRTGNTQWEFMRTRTQVVSWAMAMNCDILDVRLTNCLAAEANAASFVRIL